MPDNPNNSCYIYIYIYIYIMLHLSLYVKIDTLIPSVKSLLYILTSQVLVSLLTTSTDDNSVAGS